MHVASSFTAPELPLVNITTAHWTLALIPAPQVGNSKIWSLKGREERGEKRRRKKAETPDCTLPGQ
jgi:hypothetical protein